jgi:glycerophosphoryl diester phosphodiesterase
MLIIGHRGACGYEPENTLRSMRKALELGVGMVEFDVYCCKSGELVVIHDETVDRTTNGHGYVWGMTLAELKALDAGQGEQIPTLQELLDCVDKKCAVNIELKGAGTALPVAEAIEHAMADHGWAKEQFCVSSFNHQELLKFHQQSPGVAIGALYDGIPLNYAAFAEPLGASTVNLCVDFIDREFVEDAHRRGLEVYVWTVNSEADTRRMAELGVDGLFTNYPDKTRGYLAK